MPIKKYNRAIRCVFFITFTCYQCKLLFEINNSYDKVYKWFDYVHSSTKFYMLGKHAAYPVLNFCELADIALEVNFDCGESGGYWLNPITDQNNFMKTLFLLVLLFIFQSSYGQMRDFNYLKVGLTTIPPEEKNLDFRNDSVIKDKRNGQVVFTFDTAFAPYFDFFDKKYIIIKMVPKGSSAIHSASPIFVPIMNATIIDMENPNISYSYKGNSGIPADWIKNYRIKSRSLILYGDKRKIKFRRLWAMTLATQLSSRMFLPPVARSLLLSIKKNI